MLDDANLSQIPTSSQLQLYSEKWFLRTSETMSLTRAATLGMIEDVSELVEFVGQSLRDQTRHVLSSSGVDSSVVRKVEEVFGTDTMKPFNEIASFYQQLQYF